MNMIERIKSIRLPIVLAWRSLLSTKNYFADFVSRLIYSLLQAIIMILYVILYNQGNLSNVIGTDNYFAYILLGIAFTHYTNIALWGPSSELRGELVTGILDYVFSCPVSRYWYIVSIACGQAIYNTLFFLPTLILAIYFIGPVSLVNFAIALLSLLLTLVVLIHIGVFFSTLVLRFRSATGIFNLLNLGFQFLTGMIIPIRLLPPFLKELSVIFPMTFGIDLIRHLLLQTPPIFSLELELTVLAVEALILPIACKLSINTLVRESKKQPLTYA